MRCKVCSQAMFVVEVSVLSAGLNILFGKHIANPVIYVEPHVCPTRVTWPPESNEKSASVSRNPLKETAKLTDPSSFDVKGN